MRSFSTRALCFIVIWVGIFGDSNSSAESGTLLFNKVGDGGCPYTASFLLDTKLFSKIKWGLNWHKMESANWNAMSSCKKRFQFRKPKDYFVNHMSAFEHSTRKKLGYNASVKKTHEFSSAAKLGECKSTGTDFDQNTLAAIPFYGGRPPGVQTSSDGKFKVTSIGQGNSLVQADIKAMQTMSVICSLLKYFAYVIVGVCREEDYELMKAEVSLLRPDLVKRIHIQSLIALKKPANLPFHLLTFAKEYIKKVNECLVRIPFGTPDDAPNSCNEFFISFVNEQKATLGPTPVGWGLSYFYYTESDQILRFRSMRIRDAILSATNITTMFIGRRLEKEWKSDPNDYMKNLVPTRAVCGEGLYALDWPFTHHVRRVQCNNSNFPQCKTK